MKKEGPWKIIDGRKQFWCTQHKCPKGTYDGLYCNHDDSGHAEWQRKKDEFKANKKKNKAASAGNTSNSGNNNNSNKNGRSFKLTDKLKTALCTQGQMTPEQVEEILGQDFL